MPAIFSDEQSRNLVNLEQRYRVWIEAERALRALPYDLRRKEIGGRFYLYEIMDRSGNGKSLGPMNESKEAKLREYRDTKARLKERRDTSQRAVKESCALYRALRLPLLANEAGQLLREADRRSLLESHLLVVGTNAMPAFAVEANAFIDAPDETEDFDLAWAKEEPDDGVQTLWDLLRAVDSTYTVNTERPFQARNAKAYEVEILVAPSRAGGMFRTDCPRPVPLPEQEWLLKGKPVDHVVACRDGTAARIVAPDPRWFALQKLWMARKPARNPLKRPKDLKQGMALLNAIYLSMPHYPLDRAFEAELPADLRGSFESWKSQIPAGPPFP